MLRGVSGAETGDTTRLVVFSLVVGYIDGIVKVDCGEWQRKGSPKGDQGLFVC